MKDGNLNLGCGKPWGLHTASEEVRDFKAKIGICPISEHDFLWKAAGGVINAIFC
jgi:hypothetical protein